MALTSVTRKGQVAIAKQVRRQLGKHQGSRIDFLVIDDHVHMRVLTHLSITTWAGFCGPAGRASDRVENLDLRNALARAAAHSPLAGPGFSRCGMAPAEFSAFFRKQCDGFVATVRENNVKFESGAIDCAPGLRASVHSQTWPRHTVREIECR